jgi:hypothetical protein
VSVFDRSPLGETSTPAPDEVFPGSPSELFAQRAIRDEKKEDAARPAKSKQARPRNLGKTVLFSAAVPGTGELAGGARRGFAFLGVEALSWFAYFSFKSSGDEKEEEFEGFADKHWDIDRLKAAQSDPDCPLRPDSLDIARIEEFRQSNEQHYYEDIGKLEVYACGWDSSNNRQSYRDIRRESNRLLTNARRATTLVFINHIASAVDAFLMTRRYNRSLGQGVALDMELVADVRNPRGMITFTRRF